MRMLETHPGCLTSSSSILIACHQKFGLSKRLRSAQVPNCRSSLKQGACGSCRDSCTLPAGAWDVTTWLKGQPFPQQLCALLYTSLDNHLLPTEGPSACQCIREFGCDAVGSTRTGLQEEVRLAGLKPFQGACRGV
jgi:hypothetical protein